MRPACVADGEFAESVDADTPVLALFGSRRCCFDGGVVCIGWGGSVQCAVGAFVVVDVTDFSQLFVQVREVVGLWLST